MERDKNYDLKLTKYIWSVLRYNPPVLMSWRMNLDAIKVINRGLRFHVQGSLLVGSVVIAYNEGTDYFDIASHRDGSPEEVRVCNNVTLDGLVDLIGLKMEEIDKHEKRVSGTYGT